MSSTFSNSSIIRHISSRSKVVVRLSACTCSSNSSSFLCFIKSTTYWLWQSCFWIYSSNIFPVFFFSISPQTQKFSGVS